MLGYNSYVELVKNRFTVLPTGGSKKGTGLLILIESDFLLNDVSFLLTNVKSKKSYRTIRGEGYNKLFVENVPSG